MPRYLRRLAREYSGSYHDNLSNIGEVLEEVVADSTFEVREKVEIDYDSQGGGLHGHALILFLSDHSMEKIPVDDQRNIESFLVDALNKAASAARREYIANVYFEYLDEDEHMSGEIVEEQNMSDDHERLWRPKTIRAFISHTNTAKKYANQLASELNAYGVSSFVAHDTIEPDEDWQEEIVLALKSMDVMLAFITDDFFASAWTNQEIGYALARGVPIISIKAEKLDPMGFIRNRQAVNGDINSATSNARQVNKTIRKRLSSRSTRYRESKLHRFMNANSFDEAGYAFEDIKSLPDLTSEEIEMLVEAFNSNNQLYECFQLTDHESFFKWVNGTGTIEYFVENGKIVTRGELLDDEIPF